MVQTMFGMGSLIGISLGGVLLTVMFRYYSGLPDARPDPANAAAFVSAMNATYAVCLALLGVALVASVMRGSSFQGSLPSGFASIAARFHQGAAFRSGDERERGAVGRGKKKPPGIRRFFEICCVFSAYAKISLPPVALENQK